MQSKPTRPISNMYVARIKSAGEYSIVVGVLCFIGCIAALILGSTSEATAVFTNVFILAALGTTLILLGYRTYLLRGSIAWNLGWLLILAILSLGGLITIVFLVAVIRGLLAFKKLRRENSNPNNDQITPNLKGKDIISVSEYSLTNDQKAILIKLGFCYPNGMLSVPDGFIEGLSEGQMKYFFGRGLLFRNSTIYLPASLQKPVEPTKPIVPRQIPSAKDRIDQLHKLGSLRSEGVITDDEFQALKKEIL